MCFGRELTTHSIKNQAVRSATKKLGYVTLNGSITQHSVQRVDNEESRVTCRAGCFISVGLGQVRWANDVLRVLKTLSVRPIQHDSATPGFSLGPKDAAASYEIQNDICEKRPVIRRHAALWFVLNPVALFLNLDEHCPFTGRFVGAVERQHQTSVEGREDHAMPAVLGP